MVKILIVDDEKRNLRLMEALLVPLGYEIIFAVNGEEAFEKIKEASLDTIHRLSKAAEYKDEDTGAHILRMSNYSKAIP